ncbi:MAG: HNH endonuclease [Bradyrhizobium sp.]|uniref:HNH endonuclease n=1 Tax=Bradyrhizobium sp. TaxID=376 RepID=UPI003D0F51E0
MIEFDAPLFKLLAHNDTGQAAGHQGGIVIPKDLDPFFPPLSRRVTAAQPTQEEIVTADLFVGSQFRETVETRYQYQTWGGVRSPERRLTRNLGALRNQAAQNDMLIIERGIEDDRHYRLRLIKQNMPEYAALAAGIGNRRWGPLDRALEPVREAQVDAAEQQLVEAEQQPFALFEPAAALVESRTVRVARSRAFQRHVSILYDRRCAICGQGLLHPSGRCETQAAHIVPRRMTGSDDARNGLQLCRGHHWAFDEGLFSIDGNYQVRVSAAVLAMQQNASLAAFDGNQISLPAEPALSPSVEALAWHREHILFRDP